MKIIINKKDFRIISGVAVFLASAILIFLTSISLIFFEVADYIYLNIVGLFIFAVYFGFIPSVLYVLLLQCVMLRFNLADHFYNYTLILNLTNALIISFCMDSQKLSYKRIFLASVIMALCSRMISNQIYVSISGERLVGVASIMSVENIAAQLRVYLFSGVCATVFFYIYDKSIKILRTILLRRWK